MRLPNTTSTLLALLLTLTATTTTTLAKPLPTFPDIESHWSAGESDVRALSSQPSPAS